MDLCIYAQFFNLIWQMLPLDVQNLNYIKNRPFLQKKSTFIFQWESHWTFYYLLRVEWVPWAEKQHSTLRRKTIKPNLVTTRGRFGSCYERWRPQSKFRILRGHMEMRNLRSIGAKRWVLFQMNFGFKCV
jgi:hypothetical protein